MSSVVYTTKPSDAEDAVNSALAAFSASQQQTAPTARSQWMGSLLGLHSTGISNTAGFEEFLNDLTTEAWQALTNFNAAVGAAAGFAEGTLAFINSHFSDASDSVRMNIVNAGAWYNDRVNQLGTWITNYANDGLEWVLGLAETAVPALNDAITEFAKTAAERANDIWNDITDSVVMLIRGWDATIINGFNEAATFVSTWPQRLIDYFSSEGAELWIKVLRGLAGPVINFLPTAIEWVQNFDFEGLLNTVTEAFWGGLTHLKNAAWEFIKNAPEAIWNALLAADKALREALGGAWKWLSDAWDATWQAAVDWWTNTAEPWLQGVWTDIQLAFSSTIGEKITWLAGRITDWWNQTDAQGNSTLFEPLKTVKTVLDATLDQTLVREIFDDLFTGNLGERAAALGKIVTGFTVPHWIALANFGAGVVKGFTNYFNTTSDQPWQWIRGFLGTADTNIRGALAYIAGFFGNTTQSIKDALEDLGTEFWNGVIEIGEDIGNALGAAWTWIKGIYDDIVERGVINYIIDVFDGIDMNVRNAFKTFVTNITMGVSSAVNTISTSAATIWDNFWENLGFFRGKPSDPNAPLAGGDLDIRTYDLTRVDRIFFQSNDGFSSSENRPAIGAYLNDMIIRSGSASDRRVFLLAGDTPRMQLGGSHPSAAFISGRPGTRDTDGIQFRHGNTTVLQTRDVGAGATAYFLKGFLMGAPEDPHVGWGGVGEDRDGYLLNAPGPGTHFRNGAYYLRPQDVSLRHVPFATSYGPNGKLMIELPDGNPSSSSQSARTGTIVELPVTGGGGGGGGYATRSIPSQNQIPVLRTDSSTTSTAANYDIVFGKEVGCIGIHTIAPKNYIGSASSIYPLYLCVRGPSQWYRMLYTGKFSDAQRSPSPVFSWAGVDEDGNDNPGTGYNGPSWIASPVQRRVEYRNTSPSAGEFTGLTGQLLLFNGTLGIKRGNNLMGSRLLTGALTASSADTTTNIPLLGRVPVDTINLSGSAAEAFNDDPHHSVSGWVGYDKHSSRRDLIIQCNGFWYYWGMG